MKNQKNEYRFLDPGNGSQKINYLRRDVDNSSSPIFRKAQAWGFDVIIAIGIFIFGLVVFFLYTINYPNGEYEKLDELLYEGNIVADSLLSTGIPENWTTASVSKIGILTNNKIDHDKVEEFYEVSSTQYLRARSLFGIKYNYFVNFSQSIEISGNAIEGIGLFSQNPQNSIKVSRIAIYQNKPVTVEVQVWE